MRRLVLCCLLLPLIGNAAAAGIADLSNADAVSGLKQALTDGSGAAVSLLGRENGYFGNPQVKIPLPKAIRQIEGALRLMGKRREADELVLSMFGLVDRDEATVENYVTRKALDGLYFMIAEREKKFRQNPVGATSDIVRKVFGALR